MAECTQVILVFGDGRTKLYDPKKIDSIFFDDEKAMCFATKCLGDTKPPGGGSSADHLTKAIERRRGGGSGGPHGGGKEAGAEGPQATLTSETAAATLTLANSFEPCIHMRDCTWDCGENGTGDN